MEEGGGCRMHGWAVGETIQWPLHGVSMAKAWLQHGSMAAWPQRHSMAAWRMATAWQQHGSVRCQDIPPFPNNPPILAMPSPCRHAGAMPPCRRHAAAMTLPCRCHAVAMPRPCRSHAVPMPLPCRCHAAAMPLACHLGHLAISMPWPCREGQGEARGSQEAGSPSSVTSNSWVLGRLRALSQRARP